MLQKEEYLTTRYCSPLQEISLSSLTLICQELAIEEVERIGYDRTKTIDQGLLWVVGKQHYEITRMPRYEERVQTLTYPGKHLGPFFLRHYRILSQGGEMLIKGVAVWCIIDQNSRTIVDIAKKGIVLPVESHEGELDFPKGYPMVEGSRKEILEASFSRCDVNGHMNNTKYFDFIEDAIPVSFLKEHEIETIDISYKKEIPLGTKVEVSIAESDGNYYFHSDHFDAKLGYRKK